jgi:hypothetical protein
MEFVTVSEKVNSALQQELNNLLEAFCKCEENLCNVIPDNEEDRSITMSSFFIAFIAKIISEKMKERGIQIISPEGSFEIIDFSKAVMSYLIAIEQHGYLFKREQ